MLEAIRKHVGSLVVKILFVVLVLSFVVWGVADVFRPGGGTDWAAEVGDEQISLAAFQQEYREILQRMGSAFGSPIDAEQARALGLPGSVLNRMIEGALIDQAAADLGIGIGDPQIREAIVSDARFRNAQGVFDAEIFRAALSRAGFSEQRYVELLRRELQRQQLVTSLTGGVVTPQPLLDAIARYRGERRTAEYVRLSEAEGALPSPDEAMLRQFHQDYPGLFTAPEYRAVTAIVLSAEDVAKGIALSDEVLQQAYQERLAEFTLPERRTFRQVVFTEEAQARAARSRISEGADLADAVTAAGGAAGDVSAIGPVAHGQLPDALASAVFALQQGQTAEPVQSPLGWHLVQVTAIAPGAVQPFAEAKAQLAADLRRERAVDELVELGNRVEDALGGGATLPEAAAELGVSVRTLPAIDSSGKDAAGTAIPDLPLRFVETVFDTAQNTESPLVEADGDVYFVVHVDGVTPSALQPFEAVRAQVEDAWRARARSERIRETAEALAERVRSGTALSAIAAERGLKLITPPPFTRDASTPADQPQLLVASVFEAAPGETAVVPLEDAYAVLRVTAVLPPADEAAAATADVRSELAEQLRGDMLAQLAAALRARYPVSVNPRAFESL